MAVGVFAGVPVRDYTSAVKWYELLLGAEASFYPRRELHPHLGRAP